MNALTLLASTFGVVFALDQRGINVNKTFALLTSRAIAKCPLAFVKVLTGPTSAAEIACPLVGGPLGFLAARAAHPWLAARIRQRQS